MIINVLLYILIGSILGMTMYKATCYLIKKRNDDDLKGLLLSRSYSYWIWISIAIIGCVGIFLFTNEIILRIEYLIIFSTLVILSVVDGSIRKIPNITLVILLVLKLTTVALSGDWSSLKFSLLAFVIAWILFTIPANFGMYIGWGDIKLAAVIGFFLGIAGFFQTAMVMGILMLVYTLYLKITKKGNLKTKVAIGPFLSVGMLVSIVQPIVFVL